jgi:hypothetical protein
MVIKLDAGFFDRARAVDANRHLVALMAVLLATEPFASQPTNHRHAAEMYIDKAWDQAAVFGFTYPVSTQKYVLILLTQSKWRDNRLHWLYARRMIGLPDQNWPLESGVTALYRNIVAQHYLGDDVKTFITTQEAT